MGVRMLSENNFIRIDYMIKRKIIRQTVLFSVSMQIMFGLLLVFNISSSLNYMSIVIIGVFLIVIIKHLRECKVKYSILIKDDCIEVGGDEYLYDLYEFILTVPKGKETKILAYEKEERRPGVYKILFNFEQFDYCKEYIIEVINRFVELDRQTNW